MPFQCLHDAEKPVPLSRKAFSGRRNSLCRDTEKPLRQDGRGFSAIRKNTFCVAVPHNALVYRDLPQVSENGAYGASRAFSCRDGTLAELWMDKYAAPMCIIA